MPPLIVATVRLKHPPWLPMLRSDSLRYEMIPPPTLEPSPASGWGMVTTPPTILDLSLVPDPLVPHVLTDLRRVQRGTPQVRYPRTLILVDATAHVQQRLVASSDVIGFGAAIQLPDPLIPDLLALLAEVEVDPPGRMRGRAWFGMRPPTTRLLTPDWIPLLAALATAPTMDVAAAWCGLHRRTVQRMVQQHSHATGLHTTRSRGPHDWFQVLLAYLACP